MVLFACQESATKETNEKDEAAQTPIEQEVEKQVELEEDTVLTALNEAVRNDINNIDLYLKRAQYYIDNEDPKAGISDIDRAYRLDTNYLPTLLMQSSFLYKNGKLNMGLSILEKAKVLYPKNSDLYAHLSELFLIAKNNPKSLANADLAIKYDIYNAKAYYLKGYNFLEIGDTAKAISSYRTAIEQAPDYFDAYLELGLIFSAKDDPIALDYYKNALKVDSTEKRALYSKGMFEQEHEMYNEAMATYIKAVKIHPDFKEAHHNLGYIHLFYLKLYRESQKYFTDAIEADPRYIQAYYNRGYSFEMLGDINNAAKDYRKALSINPTYDAAAKGLSRLN